MLVFTLHRLTFFFKQFVKEKKTCNISLFFSLKVNKTPLVYFIPALAPVVRQYASAGIVFLVVQSEQLLGLWWEEGRLEPPCLCAKTLYVPLFG